MWQEAKLVISMEPYDLLLTGGWVVDPSQGIDKRLDVAVKNGRIAALDSGLQAQANRILDVGGLLVVPGLIDLHTHVYWGGTWSGVRPLDASRGGAATLVDAGSSGAGNFRGLLTSVIEPSPFRILAFLNIAFPGLFGALHLVDVPEASDIRLLNVNEAVAVAREYPGYIRGIKVRLGRYGSGALGTTALVVAQEAAELAGLPVMAHIDDPPPRLTEVLKLLRPGDVLTHAFRRPPNALVTRDGRVIEAALEARSRGVLFDVGHGFSMFSFATMRRLLAQGFAPDTISTDIYRVSATRRDISLAQVLSKFLALGMRLPDVIAAATHSPAKVLGMADLLGTLRPGALADISVLRLVGGEFLFQGVPQTIASAGDQDAVEEQQRGSHMLEPVYTIVGGHLIHATSGTGAPPAGESVGRGRGS
jgi:dihydroorotase